MKALHVSNPSLGRELAVLLLADAVAWLGLAWLAHHLGGMVPLWTALVAFAGGWALMMTAMMLPSVAPTARLYCRTSSVGRPWRLIGFTVGYLAIWSATAVPALGLAVSARGLAEADPWVARAAAAAVFALCGAYQLSPLKRACLERCRSPLSLLLQYSSFRGELRHLRAGFHLGAYCLGCCWTLMLLLLALGSMNLVAALALAAVVMLEKHWRHGLLFSRGVALAALGLAPAALALPQLSLGLGSGGSM